MNLKTTLTALAMLALAITARAAGPAHDPQVAEELRIRGGLPNFFAKLESEGPVRIAYLGGSITLSDGWRPKTTEWLRGQYPGVEIIEINAAISGTGSDFGACRIAQDVLSKNPDLIFLEHRVNGGGGSAFEAKSVEGIIRQIRKSNPSTDICLVYTIGGWMLDDLRAGRQTAFGAAMERAANTYGIPSIDLGVEVVKREKAGDLIFQSPTPLPDQVVFAKDGVHPGSAGYEIYRDVVARSMLAMQDQGSPGDHALPEPIDPGCWETATLVPIHRATLSEGWSPVDVETDGVYRDDFARTHGMLRGGVKCDAAGQTITFKWHGTTLGLSDIPYGSGIEVEVSIDGGAPVTIPRPQREMRKRYARFFYLPEQQPGDHTAVITVKALPEGQSFYAGQLLVAGTPLQ
jgi:lysophospholipase L1-like esterase